MLIHVICWIFVLMVLRDSGVQPQSDAEPCDRSRRGAAREGLLGGVPTFPWLGVLRVHLHHETSLKIALTGIVLVKDKYAIGNADDIARIPKRVFQEDSRAMFIPAERAPWFSRPVDYMTHPDYELDTLSSVALIELEPPPDTKFPMKPVCWPSYSYNVSSNLFAVGYTDDNQVLEKVIHKLQYVEQDLCKEFYNRAGLTEGRRAPLHYECGFAYNNKDSCVWDNGMALISNSSGYWVLIGLGLQGPGCAAPARFISLLSYYSWIESATDMQEIEDQGNYRKSAFNEGFKNFKTNVEYIPAHELLRSNASGGDARRQGHQKHELAHYHPMDIPDKDPFQIQRISGTEIQIKLSKSNTDRYNATQGTANSITNVTNLAHVKAPIGQTRKTNVVQGVDLTQKISALDQYILDFPDHSTKINVNSAIEWNKLLKEGMVAAKKETILQKYLIPYNCKFLKAPKLNQEIFDTLPAIPRNRDKILGRTQQQLGIGLTAVNRGLDALLKTMDIEKAIKDINNACRILADTHYQLTQLRIKLIKPSMNKAIFNLIHDKEREEQLFGDMIRKIVFAKTLEKQRIPLGKTQEMYRAFSMIPEVLPESQPTIRAVDSTTRSPLLRSWL